MIRIVFHGPLGNVMVMQRMDPTHEWETVPLEFRGRMGWVMIPVRFGRRLNITPQPVLLTNLLRLSIYGLALCWLRLTRGIPIEFMQPPHGERFLAPVETPRVHR